MTKAEWIAVDWGTSNLRAWAMQGATPLAAAESTAGMGGLAPSEFEPALLGLIENWLTDGVTDVIACGMVGARQGWVEADYRAVPCAATAEGLTRAPTCDPRLRVLIAPGVSQASPPDVMRGEETQIAGYIASAPDFDGILCLPGTHTKWVHISAGEIVSFRTFMSGEMFALLSKNSVLRHTVKDDWDDDSFADALGNSLSRPERLAGELFGIRAAELVAEPKGHSARARLSGLLIGAELAAAKPYWLGQEVVLIGAPALVAHYRKGLALQGVQAGQADGADLTIKGLVAAWEGVR